jgi:prolipoprotein diacylglyceryltransferase
VFSARFLIEFVKEDQVTFEAAMKLNMGQLLSIPFILAGILGLWLSLKYRKPGLAAAR